MATVRSLVSPPEGAITTAGVAQDFDRLASAMAQVAPFVLGASPGVTALTSAVAAEVAPELVPRLVRPWGEPAAMAAVRDGYQIAQQVREDKQAMELLVNTSPQIAASRLAGEFPAVDEAVRRHLEQYGWLRTRGYRYAPLSAETLVYRLQLVLLRWPEALIAQAATPPLVPTAEDVLGFAPAPGLAGNIAALQSLLGERWFRVDALLQAECLARPFLARVADALGAREEQVLFASVDEIAAALAGRQTLPLPEIDERLGKCRATAEPALAGMTVCRGTAVGRVRMVLDQAELDRLEPGDVLVTAASTIDPTAREENRTVFPTRRGGPNDDALLRAAAVVADEGGLLSHAAIVCRERGLPAVLGTEKGSTTLVDGQVVEVDATKPVGIVIPLGP
jgi:phosphohistidine swiveling domain-containing protein